MENEFGFDYKCPQEKNSQNLQNSLIGYDRQAAFVTINNNFFKITLYNINLFEIN